MAQSMEVPRTTTKPPITWFARLFGKRHAQENWQSEPSMLDSLFEIAADGVIPALDTETEDQNSPISDRLDTVRAAQLLGQFRKDGPTIAEPDRLHRQLVQLVNLGFRSGAEIELALHLLEIVFDTAATQANIELLSDQDKIFARNIVKFRRFLRAGAYAEESDRLVLRSGLGDDCLAENLESWSVFKVLNLALMGAIPADKGVAVVTSIRNEGHNLLEWLAHHRATGFTEFFVYTNDNTDDSDGLIDKLAELGIITLIRNQVSSGVRVQAKILEHSVHLLPALRRFQWAFYIDVDEFFIPRCEPGLTLDSFFEQFDMAFPQHSPSAICFNWKWFGSENAFAATDGMLMERFLYSIHNEHVKSLVRIKDVLSMARVHVPVLVDNAVAVDSSFTTVSPAIHLPPKYDKGQINHYWNKSFQEFIIKRSRGRISAGLDGAPLSVASFFDWGANGRRGNFDPPPDRVTARARRELAHLSALPGIAMQLALIDARWSDMLVEIDEELDLASLYESRGQSKTLPAP